MNMKFQVPIEQEVAIMKVFDDHIDNVRTNFAQSNKKHLFPKPVSVFAIANDINLGYFMAMKSGLNHRIPHRLWAERVCNSPKVGVINAGAGAHEWESVPVGWEELTRDYEPYWLGEDPTNVFKNPQYPFPSPALFVYPENYLVPKQEREFVHLLMEDNELHEAVVFTKSSVMLSDFLAEFIVVL
jgi:hypothetical protein